ncbi:hypothetical protein [Treponema sp. C6A8]|uniref:hypothetical protein n=1 Tax=Treponema sp. C6A8 TaxID=1410609 RepID=UPI0004850FEA|nr:hypothetical protein [Treponema sp. C6A8]
MINLKNTVKNDYLQQVLLLLAAGAFFLTAIFSLDKKNFSTFELLIPVFVGLFILVLFTLRFFNINKICKEKNEVLCEIFNLTDYGKTINVTLHFEKDGTYYAKPFAINKTPQSKNISNYSVVKGFYSEKNRRKVYIKNLYTKSTEKTDLFSDDPGFSPYYFNTLRIEKFSGKEYYLHSDNFKYTYLEAAQNCKEALLLISPNTYIKKLDDNKLLLWNVSEDLHFVIIDVSKLTKTFTKDEIETFYSEEYDNPEEMFYAKQEGSDFYKEIVIPHSKSGSYYLPEIKELGLAEDLLFLSYFVPEEEQYNENDYYCAVYTFDANINIMNVVPLTWFNTSSIDFTKVYPTRITKDSAGKIYLSGFGITPLELASAFCPKRSF